MSRTNPETCPSPSKLFPVILGISWLLLGCPAAGLADAAKPTSEPRAIELRDRGLALLENEKPGEAAAAFRELVEIVPDDPLGWANLAISALREQQNTRAVAFIERALALAPERSDLSHIKGDILQWSGRNQLALETYRQAIEQDSTNIEALYAMYRQATQLDGDAATEAATWALDRLIRLRPENLVLLLHRGRAAIDAGDRENASTVFLRIDELAWQGPDIATTASEKLLEALAGEDTAKARVPAARLENVLKITPMFQQGLRELNTGIQGLPVWRFADEPAPREFGPSLDLDWKPASLDSRAAIGLASADFDGDDRPDLAILSGDPVKLRIRSAASQWKRGTDYSSPRSTGVFTVDFDNDGIWDLITTGPTLKSWRGLGDGLFEAASFLSPTSTTDRLVALDYDIEGDLDLALTGADGLQLWRNQLPEAASEVAGKTFSAPLSDLHDLAVGDFDRDGDLDLAAAAANQIVFLENLRQGRFVNHSSPTPNASIRSLASADLNGDGFPDLIAAGSGLQALSLTDGVFSTVEELDSEPRWERAIALDADNDGRLDIAAVGADGTRLYQQTALGSFQETTVSETPSRDLLARDLDGDGDLDLLVAGSSGVEHLDNVGGNANSWLSLRLTGLVKGNSKNNVFGTGSLVEFRAGGAYQFREAQEEIIHFGLGKVPTGDLRVVWTNGVPQNRLRVADQQSIVEEQLLKGSCPFLYTWNGSEYAFVTDLLWGAPIGLPVAEGLYAGADPGELVEVVGAAPHDGSYELQITEELWEAAFFDQVRLWVVDHPAEVEVASNLRILPGQTFPERVHASRRVEAVQSALDARGRDVTQRVRARDEVYADGFERSRYQGRATESWTTTFDLGRAPAGPVRLHLDGWIFPSDASLNLAMDQANHPTINPRLEVETAAGWQVLMESMGFPAGKTKTMVVDTPPLPAGSQRLRIVTSLWIGWDRIAWTEHPDDGAASVLAKLAPSEADLHERGFSRLTRLAPNGPHHYDYGTLLTESPWLPFPGNYTRFGDVTELLLESDDRSVVLAAGDEMTVRFSTEALPPLAPGWQRTVFLESQGWDKDADRNTGEGLRVEPLPFRAMTQYPYAVDEGFPETPLLERYKRVWQTREIKVDH